jgi:hypothetical protein
MNNPRCFYILVIMLIISCKADPDRPENLTPNKQADDPVTISNADFEISCGEVTSDGTGAPTVAIHLMSPKFEEPVLLAEDSGCLEINNVQRKSFRVPADAVFTVSAYYAGGGNYYYGMVKSNKLHVYRKYNEESHPDRETRVEDFKPFRTLTVYPDSVAVLNHTEVKK